MIYYSVNGCSTVHDLYKKSLDEGRIPEDWKLARVTPVFKKGSKNQAGNYRPVSLTSVPYKVMESLLRDIILKHVMENNLMSEDQHGFSKGKSCMSNLLITLEDVTESLDEDFSVDIIYLDYSKAFDTVPHKRLISKFEAYGNSGEILQWIQDFLTGRKQHVSVRKELADVCAEWRPQGSVLGPILFVLYVNDLPDIVESQVKLFAVTGFFSCGGRLGGSPHPAKILPIPPPIWHLSPFLDQGLSPPSRGSSPKIWKI